MNLINRNDIQTIGNDKNISSSVHLIMTGMNVGNDLASESKTAFLMYPTSK